VKRSFSLQKLFEGNRPPGASRHSSKSLSQIALALREALFEVQDSLEFDLYVLLDEEVDLLAIALTELAEDLHVGLGIWSCLEKYNTEFFGTPLPLLWRPGDAPLTPFDPRRFQFFLYTVWGSLEQGGIISPHYRDLRALAEAVSDILAKRFACEPRMSDIGAFLNSSNVYGWEIKRKLIWLGAQSYLFRFQFAEYGMHRGDDRPDIQLVDDFICQQCTEWSGLGVIDLLAGTLKLPDSDRAVLRTWYERHAAVYRVVALHKKGTMVETMEAHNVVNHQTYSVRVEMEDCPFTLNQMVFGSLVPWHGEWYWSGQQHSLPHGAHDTTKIRRDFLVKSPQIAYRYCPDLAQRAQKVVKQQRVNFLKEYGSDFVLFPNGFSLVAAEQKRMEREFVAGAGNDLVAMMKKHKLPSAGPAMNFEREFLEHQNGVGAYFNPDEGTEYLTELNTLFVAFRKREGALTEDEQEIAIQFMRDPTVSAAFLLRLVREHGAEAIGKAFLIVNFKEKPDLDYLLRRFKGSHFRKRYPCISFLED
jgi:hypothetical protein